MKEQSASKASSGSADSVPSPVYKNNNNTSSDKSLLGTRVISGSIGSIITSMAVTPLEVAKVRTQQQQVVGGRAAGPCPRGCGKVVLFNGHLDCVVSQKSYPVERSNGGVFSVIRRIFAKEGFRGIYAGLQPTLVMAVPNTVLYFSAYEEIIWRLRQADSLEGSSWTFPFLAGGSARLVASSATSPFEFLRTLHATEGQVSQGMWNDFRGIIRTEGFGALYSGLRPTLWRDVPFSALYWFCLEEFRLYWRKNNPSPTPLEQAGQAFVNGACAGMIAAAFTTPFDVVKTLQQTSGIKQNAVVPIELSLCKHDGAVVYEPKVATQQGTFSMMREMVQLNGWSALWRGNQARMLKVAPSCAIMLSSYEFGKRLLE